MQSSDLLLTKASQNGVFPIIFSISSLAPRLIRVKADIVEPLAQA